MENHHHFYDIALIGNYTKDTIVSKSGMRVVDGGAVNYGAHAAVKLGVKTAAFTRLSKSDIHVVKELQQLGVHAFSYVTPHSTCLRLEYPTENVDQRTVYLTSSAGSFTKEQVAYISAQAIVIGTSVRDEMPLKVIRELAAKKSLLCADVQGFLRINENGKLVYRPWQEKAEILRHIDVLKTDAVEAEILTGEKNIRNAAQRLAKMGPQEIVLTHKNGLLVYAHRQFYETNFYSKALIGRSGRGDTCIASYVAKRLSSPPGQAIIWAAALTSLKMEVEGPFRGDLHEIEELIRMKYRI